MDDEKLKKLAISWYDIFQRYLSFTVVFLGLMILLFDPFTDQEFTYGQLMGLMLASWGLILLHMAKSGGD